MEKSTPFSNKEKSSLVELCTAYEDKINPNARSANADGIRASCWRAITNELNATTGTNRSVLQVKRKWDKLKSKAKQDSQKKKREEKKTGKILFTFIIGM